ncbi:MAG: thioredoxin-like domain-containing protein [Dysgonomonas sp.]
MKSRITYLFIFFLMLSICSIVKAQRIDLSLPKLANKEYVFILHKGIKQDTIQSGSFGFAGNMTINIPERNKGYSGIGVLYLKDGGAITLIVNNEDFQIGENQNGGYEFRNSIENDYLYHYYQNSRKQDIKGEKNLYADKYIDLISHFKLQNQLLQGQGGLAARVDNRMYNTSQLDLDALYTSGLWFYQIDGIARLSPDQKTFGEDMIKMLDRIKSTEVFEAITENLITITGQYGWEDAFDIIVPYVESTGRIETPHGNIYNAFTLAKIRKGTQAPLLDGLVDPMNKENNHVQKILIVFYQPDCHNCEGEMNILIKNYEKFKEKGLRIISVSSDTREDIFQADCIRFPWTDKLCDFKGFAGSNYLKYGVLGTPTFFLLDKNWVVLGRYAMISQIDI